MRNKRTVRLEVELSYFRSIPVWKKAVREAHVHTHSERERKRRKKRKKGGEEQGERTNA